MKSLTGRLWWHSIVLLMVLSMVLVACGGSNNQAATEASPAASAAPEAAQSGASSPAGDTAPATSPAASVAGATDAAGSPKLNPDVSGTIDFWHFWGSPVRRNAIRRVLAICQQQLPNIKVNETFKPFGDIWTANIAAVAAGSGMPDVIVEDRPKLPQRAADNIDQSLQEYVTRDSFDSSQFWPFAWEQTLYNDEPYGIPFETEVRVLYWNKNAFKEAGLDPEQPPKTWAELEQFADKLDKKNDDGSYARIGFLPLWNIGPDVWGYTNDVEWVSEGGQPSVNDPKAIETMEFIKKWIDRYGGWQNVQNYKGQFGSAPNDVFMSGGVAMLTDINGYTSQLDFFRPRVTNAAGEMENLDWGVSDLPYNTDKASWSGGMALSIPRGAKNPEAAWEFIKCATGPEAQASWSRDTYAMAANQAAAKDPVLLADPRWQFFVDAMSYTTGGTYLTEYPNYFEQINQRQEQVWRGEMTAQQALDEAQKAIEAEVAKNK